MAVFTRNKYVLTKDLQYNKVPLGEIQLDFLKDGSFAEINACPTSKKVYKIHKKSTERIPFRGSELLFISEPIVRELATGNEGAPCCMKMEDIFEDNKGRLVIEMIRGRDLDDCKGLSEGEKMKIAKEIVLGVMMLHQRGVAHRDLKLNNIIQVETAPGKPATLISDFGGSFKFQNREPTWLGEYGSSRPNHPPELVSDPNHIYERGEDNCLMDVWCLGLLLYEFFIGKRPWDRKSAPNVTILVKKAKELRENPPSNLPIPFKDIIVSCLDPDPKTRPLPSTLYQTFFGDPVFPFRPFRPDTIYYRNHRCDYTWHMIMGEDQEKGNLITKMLVESFENWWTHFLKNEPGELHLSFVILASALDLFFYTPLEKFVSDTPAGPGPDFSVFLLGRLLASLITAQSFHLTEISRSWNPIAPLTKKLNQWKKNDPRLIVKHQLQILNQGIRILDVPPHWFNHLPSGFLEDCTKKQTKSVFFLLILLALPFEPSTINPELLAEMVTRDFVKFKIQRDSPLHEIIGRAAVSKSLLLSHPELISPK